MEVKFIATRNQSNVLSFTWDLKHCGTQSYAGACVPVCVSIVRNVCEGMPFSLSIHRRHLIRSSDDMLDF